MVCAVHGNRPMKDPAHEIAAEFCNVGHTFGCLRDHRSRDRYHIRPSVDRGRADFRGNTQSGVVRYTHYLMQSSLAQVRSFDNR